MLSGRAFAGRFTRRSRCEVTVEGYGDGAAEVSGGYQKNMATTAAASAIAMSPKNVVSISMRPKPG